MISHDFPLGTSIFGYVPVRCRSIWGPGPGPQQHLQFPPPEADDVGDGTSSTPNKWQGLCEIYWRNVAAFESVESFLSSKTKLKICEAFLRPSYMLQSQPIPWDKVVLLCANRRRPLYIPFGYDKGIGIRTMVSRPWPQKYIKNIKPIHCM